MAIRKKIDSNETSAYIAREESPGVLPAVPVWYPLEPNSYDDFGGELELLARRPINANRQRKKGVITDLDASGGFNTDFTQQNNQDLLQGFMFADFREKATIAVTAVTADGYTVADEDGWEAGMIVYASGFTDAANNGVHVITGTDTGEIQAADLVAEATAGTLVLVGVRAAAGDIEIDASGTLPKLISAALDFEELGVIPGEWFFVGGDDTGTVFDANAVNNGYKRAYSVDGGEITIDRSTSAMVTEATDTETIEIYFGRVLKNEQAADIVRRSYQIERQLGAPNTDNPNQVQAEYLVGAMPNEYSLSIEQADKINADLSFVAMDNEQRPASIGIKPGTRIPLVEADAFNTSSDFVSIRLAVNDLTTEAPEALFEYLTDLSININNNITPNKAVGVLGAFDTTVGMFEVSGEANAYFQRIEAVQAVRNNADCSLYAIVAKANAGWIVDMPLIGLGDARSEIELDEPIMLPLSMDAATAAKANAGTDYTLMWVFFDYLPNSAMPA